MWDPTWCNTLMETRSPPRGDRAGHPEAAPASTLQRQRVQRPNPGNAHPSFIFLMVTVT